MTETVYKAFRYRIEPTEEQRDLINRTFGCSRFVYNRFLSEWDTQYRNTGKGLSYTRCSAAPTELKKTYDWLNEADSTALQSSLRDLSDAFRRFFQKQNEYPVFRRKSSAESYTSKNNNDSIRFVDKNHIRLPKLGPVRYRNSREAEGQIISATVSRKSSGRHYVSVLCEYEVSELPVTGTSMRQSTSKEKAFA